MTAATKAKYAPDQPLTAHQRKVLLALEQHGSRRAAAAALGIGPGGVSNLVTYVARQQGVANSEVIAACRRRGFLDDGPIHVPASGPQARPTNERVTRPDGTVWRFETTGGRSVYARPDGSITVTRTADLERAARMASVRWAARYGDAPMVGVVEWRRNDIDDNTHLVRVKASGNGESRTFPVVVFYPPNVVVSAGQS